MTAFDPAELSPDERARFLSSAASPRPIAWISTTSTEGVDNLAPFSAYTHVAADPPTVAVAVSEREGGGEKDTTRNARETEAFAVNVATEPLVEAVDATAEPLPPAESEFDAVGVERAECVRIDPPRVADAPLAMECLLRDSIAVGDRLLLLGEVVYVHAGDEVLCDGDLDAQRPGAVGHLGRATYARAEPLDPDR